MKTFQTLLRAGLSLILAFIVAFPLAVIFFGYSGYGTLDRAFLVLVPAFSAAYLIFESSPFLRKWQRKKITQFREIYSLKIYSLSFLFGFLLSFAAVQTFREVVMTPLTLILFSGGLTLAGSVTGYFLVRRAARSLQSGFLNRPLNLILCLSLSVFLFAFIFITWRFPAGFERYYAPAPVNWLGWFMASSVTAGILGIGVLPAFDSHWLPRFKQTRLFNFTTDNLPGFYAGGMFFLIDLVLARALNHEALTVNSVLFESDAGPWMSILGSPTEDVINRSVHPLALITLRPFVRFLTLFMGEQWQLAPMLVVAAMSGLCVLMAWLFVRRATTQRTYAFIFAVMLGSTSAHLTFGSLTDTYIFGVTSLIFFFLLIQAKENRLTVLVPAGLLVFGITITNVAQAAIGLFFNQFGLKRLIRYGLVLAASAVMLTVLTSAMYPNRQTFFFVPGDIAFEGNFVKPMHKSPAEYLTGKLQVVSRTMFLYGVVGPSPLEVIADKPPRPTIDLKTYDVRMNKLASYKGPGNIPLALWLVLLGGALLLFIKGLRSSPHLPLMFGLLGSLAFNFLLHMNYGTELFLYSSFWTYALIFFVALALTELAGKAWFESALSAFLLILMANNFWFIFTILRALAPFYASAGSLP